MATKLTPKSQPKFYKLTRGKLRILKFIYNRKKMNQIDVLAHVYNISILEVEKKNRQFRGSQGYKTTFHLKNKLGTLVHTCNPKSSRPPWAT